MLTGSSTEVLSEYVPVQATRQVLADSVDGDTEIVLRTDERTIGDRR